MLPLLLACASGDCGSAPLFADADGDGFGAQPAQGCDGVAVAGDCDDADPTRFPGASETCDDRDEDCNGSIDDVADPPAWYADQDGDQYGVVASVERRCDAPPGYTAEAGDCNDADPATNPGAVETCNQSDDDCDAVVDEESADAPLWYIDVDGDGFGDPATSVAACEAPPGRIDTGDDCDDQRARINPDADELCNGVDDDCDTLVDDDPLDGHTLYTDADGDGHGDPATADVVCDDSDFWIFGNDCDDANPDISPAADELCDGIDNNCNGDVDEASNAADQWFTDTDGDGYGADASIIRSCTEIAGAVRVGGDCDDGDAAVHPGVEDIRGNGLDEDCDGDWACFGDGDGDGAPGDSIVDSTDHDCRDKGEWLAPTDCDDADAAISPDAEEVPGDGIDQDCDGADLVDADGDGHDALAAGGDDCDDEDADVHPGASEVCDRDGTDEDCDGLADAADPDLDGARSWYEDTDGDGFGDPASATSSACGADGLLPYGDDCDDGDAAVNPLVAEACDATEDLNCDGVTGLDDHDGDGVAACEECDDADAAVFPGAPESLDGQDDDCDGLIDEYVGDVDLASETDAATFCASYQSVEGDVRIGALERLDELQCLRAVSGKLRMDGVLATDMHGLGSLRSIGGSFLIGGWQEDDWPLTPSAFTSLQGLDHLSEVGGDLRIAENAITSLDGLARLDRIDGSLSLTDLPIVEVVPPLSTLGDDLWLEDLPVLAAIGSGALRSFGGSLWIQEVAADSGGFTLDWLVAVPGGLGLVALPAGANLGWVLPAEVGALYVEDTELVDLRGLDGIRSVAGDLVISENAALTDIDALDAVETVGGTLSLIGNGALPDCGGFAGLRSIGDWLRLDGKGPTTLVGFAALTTVGTGLEIQASTLTGLTGFDKLSTTQTLHLGPASSLTDASALAHIAFTADVVVSGIGTTDLAFLAGTGPLTGNLEVGDSRTLTSLAGAEGITSVGAAVSVYDNDALTTLDGLDHLETVAGALTLSNLPALAALDLPALTEVGGDMAVDRLDTLADLTGLSGITRLGGLWVFDAPLLSSLAGLDRLQALDGSLILEDNEALASLAGLDGLATIGGNLEILDSHVLGDLAGLDSLESIGGTLTLKGTRGLLQANGLGALRTIGGDLWVEGNDDLLDLAGLGVETVGGALYFYDNDALTTLGGLEGLGDVGGNLVIVDQDRITTLAPLASLGHVGGDVRIGFNEALPDLGGLENLTTVDGDLDIGLVRGWSKDFGQNAALVSLDGLWALTTVGGDLRLTWNPVLVDITGIAGVGSIGGDLVVTDNVFLPTVYVDAYRYGGVVIGGDVTVRGNL